MRNRSILHCTSEVKWAHLVLKKPVSLSLAAVALGRRGMSWLRHRPLSRSRALWRGDTTQRLTKGRTAPISEYFYPGETWTRGWTSDHELNCFYGNRSDYICNYFNELPSVSLQNRHSQMDFCTLLLELWVALPSSQALVKLQMQPLWPEPCFPDLHKRDNRGHESELTIQWLSVRPSHVNVKELLAFWKTPQHNSMCSVYTA